MNNYHVGIYLRLSKDDNTNKESESITNQRNYILKYLKDNNYTLYKEYVDDGISGTIFERPGLEEMLQDIKKGKINLVITKDLSRLGRNNGKMSILLDEYFVNYNVRYIAINDNYDNYSDDSSKELVWLKNGINEMYALDISKKVKSSLNIRKEQGLYTGWKAPYGYKRKKDNYHKLIPDNKTKEIVKKIFSLSLENKNYSQIARYLTDKNIPTPSTYANINYTHPEWNPTTIKEILTNKVYLGHTVQGKRKKLSYKLKKEIKVPKENWIVVENTHEAIIDLKTFNLVQKKLINKKRKNKIKEKYLFSNLLYCKECNHSINIIKSNDKKRLYCSCSYYRRNSKKKLCTPHSMNYKKLEKDIIKKIYDILKNTFEELNIENKNEKNIENNKRKILLATKKADINYLNKKITRKQYNIIKKDLDNKLQSLNNIIKEVYDLEKMLNDSSFLEYIIQSIYITKDKDVEIHLKFNSNF